MQPMFQKSCLSAIVLATVSCSYPVRESNIVIPRAGTVVDIVALRQQLPDYRVDEVRIPTPDAETLYSIRFTRDDAIATILYFGGNGYTLQYAPRTVMAYKDVPVNVVLVDHRGYGQSTGVPTLDTLMSDADAVYEHTLEQPIVGAVPVIVHGHSLGSFMAGYVADRHRLAGLILESSVTTTEDWTMHLRAKQSLWARLLVRKVVPGPGLAGRGNRDVAAALDEPVLFVVGENDDVTPAGFSQTLFDASPLPEQDKHLLVVADRNHMNATQSPQFRAALSALVTQVVDKADHQAGPAASTSEVPVEDGR